jgi:hypothetical protein
MTSSPSGARSFEKGIHYDTVGHRPLTDKEVTMHGLVLALLLQAPAPQPVPEPFHTLAGAIMAYHEEVTDVRYDVPPPPLRFESLDRGAIGRYRSLEGVIVLDDAYAACDVTPLLDDLTQDVEPTAECDLSELRSTLSHELGHFLVHVIQRRDVPDSWLDSFFKHERPFSPDEAGALIVNEGLGSFFGRMFEKDFVRFDPNGWTAPWIVQKDFSSFLFVHWIAYPGGYDLVEPILTKRGATDGIRWILEHELIVVPPDLSVVPRYRAKALADPLN